MGSSLATLVAQQIKPDAYIVVRPEQLWHLTMLTERMPESVLMLVFLLRPIEWEYALYLSAKVVHQNTSVFTPAFESAVADSNPEDIAMWNRANERLDALIANLPLPPGAWDEKLSQFKQLLKDLQEKCDVPSSWTGSQCYWADNGCGLTCRRKFVKSRKLVGVSVWP